MSNGVEGSFGNYLYTEMLGWYSLRMFHTKMGDERVVVVMRNFGGGNINKLHQHSFTSKERLEVLLQLANIIAKAIDM